ncbi:peptidoglycan D,D-transpeptidase FtsI family protein [Lyticum sinuosum]|uniref:Peptidoglycan synthase FtsI n=1 Tax=Lyticum sinuosum TaxID=1332059 RepID=A0AAE5AGQ4_9RICK|nr:penicillin-binding protein 2 [Lyticum sinuosum]MDZ5761072.1 Peptidoglycan synthase FtsI [Lyticum sinuosum]
MSALYHDNNKFNCIKKERITIVICFFIVCYFLLSFRLIELSLFSIEKSEDFFKKNDDFIKRASIFDINGIVIAKNIPTSSVYVHPYQVSNIKTTAELLGKILDINESSLYNKLKENKRFIWIKRHISPLQKEKINNLGINGIYITNDEKRFYPQENLCSHLIGYLDIDGNGLAGIERGLDEKLKNYPNEPIILSLDLRVQTIVRSELMKTINTYEALGGSAIVLDLENNQIVSMVNLPDFNPNRIKDVKDRALFNTSTMGITEMGSIFKVFTLAIGLNSGSIKLEDSFNISKPLKIGRHTINDYRGKGGIVSVPEVLMYSSNIATAQIADHIGHLKQKQYMKALGLLDPIKTEIKETGHPIFPDENRWKGITMTTISYGHGIAVTPLHVVQAFASVVNGGILFPISFLSEKTNFQNNEIIYNNDNNDYYLLDIEDNNDFFRKIIKNFVNENENKPVSYSDCISQNNFNINSSSICRKLKSKKIFSTETSKLMRKILRLTTLHGFASKSNIPEYFVGMKTGTAEKVINTKKNEKSRFSYSKEKNIVYCVGAFPINEPKYVIYISIDEPKKNKLNLGFATGGMVAAPLAGKIIQQIGPILNVEIQNKDDSKIIEAMHLNFKNYHSMVVKKTE